VGWQLSGSGVCQAGVWQLLRLLLRCCMPPASLCNILGRQPWCPSCVNARVAGHGFGFMPHARFAGHWSAVGVRGPPAGAACAAHPAWFMHKGQTHSPQSVHVHVAVGSRYAGRVAATGCVANVLGLTRPLRRTVFTQLTVHMRTGLAGGTSTGTAGAQRSGVSWVC
jgi:hypothetical protein